MSDSNSIMDANSGWTQRDQCTYGGNMNRVQTFWSITRSVNNVQKKGT